MTATLQTISVFNPAATSALREEKGPINNLKRISWVRLS